MQSQPAWMYDMLFYYKNLCRYIRCSFYMLAGISFEQEMHIEDVNE